MQLQKRLQQTQQCLIALIEKWKNTVGSGKSFRALLTNLSLLTYQKLLIVLTSYFQISQTNMASVYQHYGLLEDTYSIGDKEQKLMQAITLVKSKSCLEFHKDQFWNHYFLKFSCATCLLILMKLTFLATQMTIHPFYIELRLKTQCVPQEAALLVYLNGFEITK